MSTESLNAAMAEIDVILKKHDVLISAVLIDEACRNSLRCIRMSATTNLIMREDGSLKESIDTRYIDDMMLGRLPPEVIIRAVNTIVAIEKTKEETMQLLDVLIDMSVGLGAIKNQLKV